MQNWKLYVDMDGVLCYFNQEVSFEDLLKENYFRNVIPIKNAVNSINTLSFLYPDHIKILSHCVDSPFAENEKREWIHRHLSNLRDHNIIMVPYGQNKFCFVSEQLAHCDILLDDHNDNLCGWNNHGGTAIKFVNDINDKHRSWIGNRIYYNKSSKEMMKDLISEINCTISDSIYMPIHGREFKL